MHGELAKRLLKNGFVRILTTKLSKGLTMAANPNPTNISASMWKFWEKFAAYEKQAQLGGIYANKSGYHNYRNNLSSSDYSVEEVANDRKGSAYYSNGIDLTLNDSDMQLYSKRLQKAFKNKDPRLYVNGEPAVREFIGTLDGNTVYCYMLTGGVAQGVGSDSGEDWGRDESHLWHIHLSFIRKFGDVWQIFSGVLSILMGEAYSDWEFNDDMGTVEGFTQAAYDKMVQAVTQGALTYGGLGPDGKEEGGITDLPGVDATNVLNLHDHTAQTVIKLETAVTALETTVADVRTENTQIKEQLNTIIELLKGPSV
jgi:hypothetical protein